MENILQIDRGLTHSKAEKLLKQIHSNRHEKLDFMFDCKFNPKGFGNFSLFLLVYFTWIRERKGDLILTDKVFVSELLGYLVLSSSWLHTKIVDKERNDIKLDFQNFTKSYHRRIDFLEYLPNNEVVVPNFDHYSKEKGYSHWFYDSNYMFFGSPDGLSNSTYRIFNHLNKIYHSRLNLGIKDVLDDLDMIIWELVGNTHFHARHDYLGQTILSPSTRGLYLKIHRSNKDNFIKGCEGHAGMISYYNSTLPPNGDSFILEISVFDSGPGFVKRFLGKEWNNSISLQEQVTTTKKCLAKGVSSAPGANGKARGFGLNNVLKTLSKKKGFLKIRTGNIAVYRDLVLQPHVDDIEYEDIELQDWESCSSNSFTNMEDVAGVSITLSYPLSNIL
jgi:hypothetical protein